MYVSKGKGASRMLKIVQFLQEKFFKVTNTLQYMYTKYISECHWLQHIFVRFLDPALKDNENMRLFKIIEELVNNSSTMCDE